MHPSTLLLNQPLALSAGRTAIMARLFRDGASAESFFGDKVRDDPPYEIHQGIAVIPISGVLLPGRGWSWSGVTYYSTIRASLADALDNPDVSKIALLINSPGGTVSECADTADVIHAARGIKPIWAILDDTAYSAAYALASSADFITVPRVGGVGSIGCVGMHVDITQALEKAGSPDKLFLRVAASLRQIRSPAAQAVAAATLFGGAAQGLMPIFQQTNRQFENNIRLAERYGLFNQKGVDAADRLRKAQQQLELAVRGFGNSLAESLEPAIRPVIEGMADWIAANRQWIAQDITSYVRQFVTWLRAGGWNRIRGDIEGVYHAITNVVDRLGGWKSAGRDALIAVGALYALPVLAGLGSLATAIIAVASAFGRMGTAAGAAAAASRAAQVVGASPPGWNGVPSGPTRAPMRVSPLAFTNAIGIGYEAYQAHRSGVLVRGEGESALDSIPGWTRFNRWWNRKSGAATAPLDQPIQQMATALAQHYGIDPSHYTALLRQEHGGYRNVSPAGAFGPSQLMPGTARALGIADSVNAPNYDWRQNLDAGARYYRQQLDRYHGDYAAADAAYNAGPNSARVQQFAQTHDLSVLPRETQGYVANIARMSGGTPPVQRIQVEIDHRNAPPGTRARVTNAPPGTRRAATGFTVGGNVERIQTVRSLGGRYSKVTAICMGTVSLFTDPNVNALADQMGVLTIGVDATDPGVPRTRNMFVPVENGDQDNRVARQRVQWEVNRRIGRAYPVTLTADRWRDAAGQLWLPNMLAPVTAADGTRRDLLIGELTLRQTVEDGTHADVVLMPPGAYSPEPMLNPVLADRFLQVMASAQRSVDHSVQSENLAPPEDSAS
ncbi:phage baseplate assembly protein [Novacetimonas hansenii]|uniref:phage baseplate assembly protein n=1 Tax=Novacetimonas hansenii TaxID=436 RepID=UPI000AF97C0D|nr:transglycosylase SLT domain-containing protein [Novacetimonas hansenii]